MPNETAVSVRHSNTSNTVDQKLVKQHDQKLVKCEPFWRVPKSVGECLDLTFSARCIYGVLASKVRFGNVSIIGQNEIARRLGCSRTTVVEGIKELIQFGKIKCGHRAARSRSVYELQSDIFAQKMRDGERLLYKDPDSQHVRNVGGEGLVSEPRKKTA